MKIAIIHLGCPKNQTWTETLAGWCYRSGLTFTEPEEAEVVVINTCGFLQASKEESIDWMLRMAELKKMGKLKKLLITGCMAGFFGKTLKKEIPEIDTTIPLNRFQDLQNHLPLKGEPHRLATTLSHAYLRIAEGCDHTCSFCIIPTLTGSFTSRPLEELIQEAQMLEAQGIPELILVAQDTTQYGKDLDPLTDLFTLVQQLLEKTAFPWIRVMYLYPETIDLRLISLMAQEPRLLPYVDLPFQHASPSVLARMRRGGGAKHFLNMIQKMRQICPGLIFRSTFITGFPGEKEEDVATLLDFLKKAQLDHVGIFTYSDEPEAQSFTLKNKIPKKVAESRRKKALLTQQAISFKRHQALVGKELLINVDEVTSQGVTARWAGMAPDIDGSIHLPPKEVVPGDLRKVIITQAFPYDLKGQWVE